MPKNLVGTTLFVRNGHSSPWLGKRRRGGGVFISRNIRREIRFLPRHMRRAEIDCVAVCKRDEQACLNRCKYF